MHRVLVVLEEVSDGDVVSLSVPSISALGAGSYFSSKHSMELVVFVFGSCSEELSRSISSFSVSSIFFFPVDSYEQSLYLDILTHFINDNSIGYIISAGGVHSYEYLPMLSGRLSCSISNEVYAFDLDEKGNGLVIKRAYYTSKLIEELVLLRSPIIISLAGGVFLDEEGVRGVYKGKSLSPSLYEYEAKRSSEVVFIVKRLLDRVADGGVSGGSGDLMRASVIVSGGIGLEDASNFALVEELALCLGASVGASRAVVDLGWRNYSEQIGQTGKIVSPSVYIACGIRGAIQHIVGIRQSKYIIAINKDKEAPIFRYADIGIVGDVLELLPLLIKRLTLYKRGKPLCKQTS